MIVNTAALQNTDLISDISKKVGSQSLIVAIDVKKTGWERTVQRSFG